MLLSKASEPGTALERTALKPTRAPIRFRALLCGVIGLALAAPALAADHGTIVREAIIYISPDASSHKLAQVERGREIILLDKSRNWVNVEALLGYVNNPDPAFVSDDD